MTKLQAEVNGKQHDVSIQRREEHTWSASVDGRAYELQVRNPAAGEYLIVIGTEVFACRVGTAAGSASESEVSLRGTNHYVLLIDPKRLRSGQSVGQHDHGLAQVVAPMPGKVVRLLVAIGAQVEAGAGIVVVEAMKMQNEMKAPKAGVVTALNAAEGATVNAGDVLAVIE